jgi:hypothetical protein
MGAERAVFMGHRPRGVPGEGARSPKVPTWQIGLLLALAITLATVGEGGPTAGQGSPLIQKSGYTSSAVCGGCHEAIYKTWKNSLHAGSLSDPVFDTAYMLALKEYGPRVRELCLRCHAPTTRVTRDWDLTQAISREGVTCDFCHTVTALDIGNWKEPYRMRPGPKKYGPLRNAASPVHEVEFRDFFTRSEFCGGCHEFVGPNGVKILGTYSEWQASPYAREGKQCQDCHMPLGPGPVVAFEKRGAAQERSLINLHDIQGGHSAAQVSKAAAVKITEFTWEAGRVDLAVSVVNVGSGHMLPTGIPSRRVVLTVLVQNPRNEKIFEKQIEFRKAVVDRSGRELTQDHQILLSASEVAYDSRLAPMEARTLQFTFSYSGPGPLAAEARLTYLYGVQLLTPQEMRVEMGEDRRRLR